MKVVTEGYEGASNRVRSFECSETSADANDKYFNCTAAVRDLINVRGTISSPPQYLSPDYFGLDFASDSGPIAPVSNGQLTAGSTVWIYAKK